MPGKDKFMKAKASVSKKKRTRGSVTMWIVAALCLVALVFIVYNIFIVPNVWYVISYTIGIVLGGSYILVCLNELYSTWIFTDGKDLFLKCWDNCFFPYQTLAKPQFIAELLPAKNVRLRVPVSEIDKVYIGTKTFIKRNTNDESFLEAVALYENASYSANNRMLEKIDILYIATTDNDSVFMSVTDFDEKEIMRLMRSLENSNPGIEIKLSGKKYRSYNG